MALLLADPHIGRDIADDVTCEDHFRIAASHAKRLQPDLIFVPGDLTQNFADETQSQILQSILEETQIPYHVVAGNTDVRSRPRLSLLNAFVEQWQLPYYWYTVEHYNTLFVMLDSNILRNRDNPEVDPDVAALAWEELDWLASTLEQGQDQYQHIVPISHHPLAIEELNEDDDWSNTPQNVRKDIVDIYQQYPDTVTHVLAGHLHDSARIQTGSQQFVTYPAATFMLGERPREPSGFAILTVDGSTFDERYYGYDDLPRRRPESDNPGFLITFPSGQDDLIMGSKVCISWTSTSMSNYVRLEYSMDNGTTWSLVEDNVPNQGVFPWTIPASSPRQGSSSNNNQLLLVSVSSVYDGNIYAVSQEPNRISVPAQEEFATEEPTGSSVTEEPTSATSTEASTATGAPTAAATKRNETETEPRVWNDTNAPPMGLVSGAISGMLALRVSLAFSAFSFFFSL